MTTNDEMLRDHQRTWGGFVRLITGVVLGMVILLGGMAIFLL